MCHSCPENEKTGLHMGDIDDVTLGSPAVFLGERRVVDPTLKVERSAAFRPLFTEGLALK